MSGSVGRSKLKGMLHANDLELLAQGIHTEVDNVIRVFAKGGKDSALYC